MACKYNAPNLNESILYNKILDVFTINGVPLESMAKAVYNSIYDNPVKGKRQVSENFKEFFGDFMAEYEENGEMFNMLDVNGEPELLEDETGHYFLSPDKQRKKYIDGEFSTMTAREVDDITNNLAFYIYDKIRQGNTFVTREEFEQAGFEDMSIIDYIEEFIDEHIDNEDAKIRSLLIRTEYYKDAFRKRIGDFFNSRGIAINERSEFDVIDDDGNIIYDRVSFEIDSKDRATYNIKLLLSFIPDTEDSSFGHKFLPFDKVWGFLEPKLAGLTHTNTEDGFDSAYQKMIRTLESYENYVPWVSDLLAFLNDSNINLQRQFFVAFDKEFANFTSSTFQPKGKIWANFNSQRNSPALKLMDRWFLNFIDSNLVNTKEHTQDKEALDELIKRAEAILKTDPEERVVTIKALFSEIGINLNERTILNTINNLDDDFNQGTIDLIDGFSRVVRELKKPLVSEGRYKNHFKNQKTLLEPLAQEQSEIEGDLNDNTILVGTKQFWEYANFSMLNDIIARIKQGETNIIDSMLVQSPNSRWLQYIKEKIEEGDTDFLKNFNIKTFSSFRLTKSGDRKASTAKEIEFSDLLAVEISQMLSVVNYNRNTTTFPMITMGDKSTFRMVSGMPFIKGAMLDNIEVNEETGEITVLAPTLNKEVYDAFYGYFMDEYNRIAREWEKIFGENKIPEKERIIHYHTDKKGNLIEVVNEVDGEEVKTFFKDINDALKFQADNGGQMNFLGKAFQFNYFSGDTQAQLTKMLMRPDGNVAALNESIKEKIQKLIGKDIIRNARASVEEIKRRGIDERVLDSKVMEKYGSLENALYDFVINGRMGNIEVSKVFYGDIAYFKSQIEVNKRAQALGIDGYRLSLGETKGDHIFRAAVVEDVDAYRTKYLSAIEETYGKDSDEVKAYKKVNRTDAQAWITPERWKFIIERLGRWNDNLQNIYDKMNRDEDITAQEFNQMNYSMQALKGVYYGIHNGRPVYLKYSQAVLVPTIAKNNGMGRLLARMREDKVDEVITLDGVKVGALQTTRIANKDMTDVDIAEKLDPLNSFELDNRNWRLQQDLPNKGIKSTQIGSQLMKNILANFDAEAMADIGGQEMLDQLMADIAELSNEEANDIRKALNLGEGKLFDRDKLNKLIMKELKDRKAGSNILKALERGISYEAIPQHLTKIENILFSYVRNRVSKLTTLGAGLIQMSSFGFDKMTRGEKNDIVWFDQRAKAEGLAMPTKGKPGEILISGSFLTKIIPNWRELTPEQLQAKIDGNILDVVGYRIPNQGISSNDNLRIVGVLPDYMGDAVIPYAEITTKTGSDFDIDKMYIMMPEFVGKPTKGWQSRIKKANPGKTVFDMLDEIAEKDPDWDYRNDDIFVDGDINVKALLGVGVAEITSKEYNTILYKYGELYHPELMDFTQLKYATSGRRGLRNRIIKSYWDILNHPTNYEEKMQPLDASFLKNSIERLSELKKPRGAELDFFDPVNQLIIKYNYMGGKAGLGAVANNVVDHPIAQLAKYGVLVKPDGVNVEYTFDLSREMAGDLRISQVLSSFLNAFVDIAKDDYIVRGNHNLFTNSVAMFMVRNGYDVDTVNAFLMQDIMFDLVDETNLQHSKVFRKFDDKKIKANAIETVSARYSGSEGVVYKGDKNIKNLKDIKLPDFQNREAFKKFLMQELENPTDTGQLQIMALFKFLQTPASTMRKAMVSNKQDVNGPGNDLATLWANQDMVLESYLGDNINYLNRFDNTYFDALHKNSIELLNEIIGKMFTFPQNRTFVNEVAAAMGKFPNLDHNSVREIIGFSRAMWYSKIPVLRHDNPIELFTELPDQVREARKRMNNFFLDNLEIEIGEEYSFISVNQVRKKTNVFEESMYNGWKQLMEESPKLADELVKHAFYSTGFTSKIKSLVPYIPHEWMYQSGFVYQLENESSKIALGDEAIEIFFRNNWNNNNIVRGLPEGAKKKLSKNDSVIKVLDNSMFSDKNVPYPIIRYRDRIYRLTLNETKKTDKGYEYDTTYEEVGKLGYSESGNNILEFERDSQIDDVVPTENGLAFPSDMNIGMANSTSLDKMMGKIEEKVIVQPAEARKSNVEISSDTKINIYAGSNENAHLSNFANRPFTPNLTKVLFGENAEIKFNTVEGAFQAAKALYSEEDNTELVTKLQTATGAKAKKLGRQIKGLNVKEWDKVSSNVMKDLISASFEQNPNALQSLLDTGNATLTHTQDKGKWGTEFPRILMEVREELSQNNDTQFQKDSPYKAIQRLNKLFGAQKGKFIPIPNEGTLQNLRTSVRMVNQNFGENKVRIELTSDGRSAMLKSYPSQYEMEQRQKFPEGFDEVSSVEQLQEQIKYLSEKFNAVVIEDDTLQASGALLGKNHPLTKKYGKPVIVINPNMVFSDTVIHEFAHLFIDLLGGMDNVRIKAAVEYLRGTALWAEIEKLYPELNEDMLAKEVLATALGKEGAEIFDSEVKKTWWNRFLDWFFNLLGMRIAERPTILRELAKEIISGKIDQFGSVSEEVQFRKMREAMQTQRIDTKEKLVKKAEQLIIAKIRTARAMRYNKEDVDNTNEIVLENLATDLNKLRDIDAELAMEKFAAYIIYNVNYLSDSMDAKISEDKVSERYLSSMDSYFKAYKEIHNLASQLIDNKETLAKLANASEVLNRLIDRRDSLVRQKVVDALSGYSIRITLEFKERFEAEANHKGLKGEEKEAYVNEKLAESKEEIQQLEKSRWNDKIYAGDFNIGTLEMWLRDPKSISSEIINIVSVIIDEADQTVRNIMSNIRPKMTEEFEKYRASKGVNLAPEKMYANLLQQDAEGNYYLIDEYHPEFYRQHQELVKAERNAAVEHGLDSPKHIETKQALGVWRNENMDILGFPIDKWKNKGWKTKLTKEELEFVSYLKNRLQRDDNGLNPYDKLVRSPYGNTRFFQIPRASKSQYEAFAEGNWKEAFKIDKIWKRQPDEEDEFGKLFTDHSNTQRQGVPMFFRTKVRTEDQSLDLPTLFLMNSQAATNYKAKQSVAPLVELIAEVVGHEDRKYYKSIGTITSFFKGQNGEIVLEKSEREHKALMSTIENRLYSIKEIPQGNMNKVARALASYTGLTLLAFNLPAAITNIFQGKFQQLIESVGSQWIDMKSFYKAERLFAKDLGNILSQTGTLNQNSKTMLLLDKFKGLSDWSALRNRFSQDTRLKAMLDRGSLNFMMEGGEFYMHATLMYAVLSNVKAMNSDGKYINSKGEVVSKADAMNMADAYTVKDGKLVLNSNVAYNSFNPSHKMNTEKGEVSLTNLIGKLKTQLFGNYDKELKALVSRYWWGRLLEMFRKFIVPGFDRRWRSASSGFKAKEDLEDNERFADMDTRQFEEGFYTSTMRFLGTIYRASNELGYGVARIQHSWNEMTDQEKRNVTKTVTEMAIIITMGIGAQLIKGMGDDEPDDVVQDRLYWTAFLMKRLHSELSFFMNPFEAGKILHNPAVTMSMAENIFKFLDQGFEDAWNGKFELYDRGSRKGESKLGKYGSDLIPILRFGDYDVREKMKWYFREI